MRWRFLLLVACVLFPLQISYSNEFYGIQKSPLDKREYMGITLDNGLRVLVVSDREAPMAGAAVVVGSGLYDDPTEFPGLAHFLEHMLFLGTQRFPVADEFQHYIQAHGGRYNAVTEGEKTSFFFSVQPEAFPEAIERLGDFFIAPTFDSTYVERELHAVDQEFQLYLHKDSWAIHEVNKETSNPEHPFYRYFGGNQETLGKNKVALEKALRMFFKQHYHAGNMTVVLVGPQSTQMLVTYARQHFSAVSPANNTIEPLESPEVFREADKGLDIHIKAKGEYRALTLTFPLAREKDYTAKKYAQCIALILGDEREGSVTQTLKKKQWITGASVSLERFSKIQEGLAFTFSLTDKGMAHIDDITRQVFTMVSMLRRQGVPKHVIEEMKHMDYVHFLYMEKQEAASFALSLANNMHERPLKEVISGDFLFLEDAVSYDDLKKYLIQLKPENLRRLIIHPKETGDKRSQWYEAEYRVKKLSLSELKKISQRQFFSGLAFAKENPFLPKQFTLEAMDHHSKQAVPVRLQESKMMVWHYPDVTFRQPRGVIFINFRMPWVVSTPQNNVLAKVYTRMLMNTIKKQYYAAGLAGATIAFEVHPRGLTMILSGYTDRQAELLEKILRSFQEFQGTKKDFEGVKETLCRQLNNVNQKTLLERSHLTLKTVLLSPFWHPDVLRAAGATVSYEAFSAFRKLFWDNVSVEMLVYGNYTAAQAQALSARVSKQLTLQTPSVLEDTDVKMLALERGKQYYTTVSPEGNNHVLIGYLQNHAQNEVMIAKTLMLAHLLEVPYFQTIRVEKQLGYSVGMGAQIFKKSSGLLFWIQSGQARPATLISEIHSFFNVFNQQVTEMDPAEFMAVKESLIQNIMKPALTFDEEAARWWTVIESGDVDFYQREKIAEALALLTPQDIKEFSEEILLERSKHGQLWVLSEPPTTSLAEAIALPVESVPAV